MTPYRSYTDDELVRLIADDDYAAYTEIYDRYAGVLYVHARKKLNDREAAKDLVQDLFLYMWEKRNYLSNATRLSTYLYAAVRYKVINRMVHEKRLAALEATCAESDAEDQVWADHLVREHELRQLIEAEVKCLPKKMREIFHMSRQQQLSHKEIAEQLNLSQATVKKQVNNALKVLRIKLGHLFAIVLCWWL